MSHTVTVHPSEHTFEVQPGETILEAGLREGLALPYGCRDGACGSCIGKVLRGAIHYRREKPPGITEHEAAEGKALFCQAIAEGDLDIEVREIGAARDIRIRVLPCRVQHMKRVADDVMVLKLRLPATERLQFLAGQYIDIILRDGRRRGFSLANAPHNDEFLELHVRHVPGGKFTGQVFGDMKEKTILRFEGPLGTFFLREDSERPVILMGGGTGFAPLKAIVDHAVHAGIDRPIHVFWGARGRKDLYLHELAASWAEKHSNIAYTPVLSDPEPGDSWGGATGFVHEAVCASYPDLSDYQVYMSGPPAMIEAARAAFAGLGLPDEEIYFDSFDYAADTRTAIEGA